MRAGPMVAYHPALQFQHLEVPGQRPADQPETGVEVVEPGLPRWVPGGALGLDSAAQPGRCVPVVRFSPP